MKRSWLIRFSLTCLCAAALSACAPEATREAKPEAEGSIEVFTPEPVRSIFKRSCASCHGHDGRGITGVAPDWRRGQPRSADEWEKYLSDPQGTHPATQMPPPVWMNPEEIKAVAALLAAPSQPEEPTDLPR